jgi:hypothetical protein
MISKFALIHGLVALKIFDFEHSLKILQTNVTTYLSLSELKPSTSIYLMSISLARIGLFCATVIPPANVPRLIRYYLTGLPYEAGLYVIFMSSSSSISIHFLKISRT